MNPGALSIKRTFFTTLMVPATAALPALSSAALLTALAARARSSDASLAGDAGVLTFAAAAAGVGAFLAGAEAFLAGGAEGFFAAAAAFLAGDAAATALATPAAAAERLDAGRLEGVGVVAAFLAGVGVFLAGVEEAFFAGDFKEEGRREEREREEEEEG